MKTYEVPILVNVRVEVNDTGEVRVLAAHADNECAPWAGSSEPAGFNVVTQAWDEGYGSAVEPAWQGAYAWLAGDLVEQANKAGQRDALLAAVQSVAAGAITGPGFAKQKLAELGLPELKIQGPFTHYLRRVPPRAAGRFTPLEQSVLRALIISANGNGNDFGFIEDARNAVNANQLGGVISSLVKKDVIVVHDEVSNETGTWTQFTWACDPDDAPTRHDFVGKLIIEVAE